MTVKIRSMLVILFFMMSTSIGLAKENVIPSGEVIFLEMTSKYPFVVEELAKTDLEIGDMIIRVKDKEGNIYSDIKSVYKQDLDLVLIIKRNNKIQELEISSYDFSKGILREKYYGIATLTYVDSENNRFQAVAHPCFIGSNKLEITSGNIYLTDYVQSGKNKISRLSYKFSKISGLQSSAIGHPIGEIKVMSNVGVSGTILDKSFLKGNNTEMATATEGKAYILTEHPVTNEITPMEIEITEIENSHCKFKVVDEDLLNTRNGIVRGMSGSPVIQDGKLVGAVSHSVKKGKAVGYFLKIEEMVKGAYRY